MINIKFKKPTVDHSKSTLTTTFYSDNNQLKKAYFFFRSRKGKTKGKRKGQICEYEEHSKIKREKRGFYFDGFK